MTIYDDPNREALGLAPAWEEGSGGSEGGAASARAVTDEDRALDLEALSKEELLAFAKSLGVRPANAAMTKEDLRAGVDEKLAGG